MMRVMKRFLLVVMGAVLALSMVSCASTQPSGFLGDYYKNLQPGPEGGVKQRWIKPGVDFAKYDKVMVDSVIFYFAPDSDDSGIDPLLMKDLSDAFNLELANALKDKYPIVADPGPDVLRIKIALTGIKQSRPVLSGVTTILPVGLVISAVRKEATGSWSGSGATGAELMMIDTLSNDVVAVAQDEQTAAFTERFTKYGSANEAFKFWAGRIRAGLDQVHTAR